MHRKVAAALVAAFALGIGGAGCGSSSTPLTRAQLVRRIEAACRAGQQEAQRQMGSRRTSRETGTAFLAAIVTSQRAILAKVEDLDPPDAAKDDFEAFKQGMQQRTALIARVQEQGGADLQRAMAAVQAQAEVVTRRLQQAVARLGVRSCV
jgi:hypothetical protein